MSSVLGVVDYAVCYIMDMGTEDARFICCCHSSKPGARRCTSWRQFDWLFYATFTFVIVGLCEIFNAPPFEYSEDRNVINQVIWTVDATLYLIDWFAWQEGCCGPPDGDGDMYTDEEE